jgi:DNA sulfur modification protein DndC
LLPIADEGVGIRERIQSILDDLRLEYEDFSHSYPWVIGYSGGKDSTVVLQLVIEVLKMLPPSKRRRRVYVITNDTQVESPLLAQHVDNVLQQLTTAMVSLDLPVTVHKCLPNPDKTFWVNLIGRGYPAPNRQFRWCTDRLKIAPTSEFILNQVASNGHVILVLGVRKSESSTRRQSIERHHVNSGNLQPHSSLKGAFVFSPIVDLSTSEVWDVLLQRRPPWGGTHRALITLYRNAQGGECPLVITKDDAPSCGSSSSRFGCWTCTVVEKDRSLSGLVDSGFDNLEPLLDFRDWLYDTRNQVQFRQQIRRNGQGGLGPYTFEMRETILTKLLEVQSKVGFELIKQDEIERIKDIWLADHVMLSEQLVSIFEGSS